MMEPVTLNYSVDSLVGFGTELFMDAQKIFLEANKEYSTDNRWTSNFDFVTMVMRLAGHASFQPRDAALVYAMKSLFSIAKRYSTRQSMRSRYIDILNYLTFMAWMDEYQHDIKGLDDLSPFVNEPMEESPGVVMQDAANDAINFDAIIGGFPNEAQMQVVHVIMAAPSHNHEFGPHTIEALAQKYRFGKTANYVAYRKGCLALWNSADNKYRAQWGSYNEYLTGQCVMQAERDLSSQLT